MASTIFLVPIPADKVDAWKAFVAEAHGTRKAEHDASRKRGGVTHEVICLVENPQGAFACIYREAGDMDSALSAVASSNDPYDKWFLNTLADIYGTTLDTHLSASSRTVHAEYRA